MIFGSFAGRHFIEDVDNTVHRTLCQKCSSVLYYKRDGGFALPGSEASGLFPCPYCHKVNRVQRITIFRKRHDGEKN
jgi:RNase P subunit RPR2